MPSRTTIKEYIKEYCNSTAIHGVRYLAEGNRNPIEKLFWIIALTMCLTGCYLMVLKVKEKLDTTPVLVTFAETATNIWHVPFPAVTVCPETKSRQSFLNFTKYNNVFEHFNVRNVTMVDDDNMTITSIPDDIRQKMDALGLVCLFEKDDPRLAAGLGKPLADEDDLKFLYKSTIQLDNPEMSDCYWGGRKLDGGCWRHLKPVWSEDGVCFSFNMMPDSVIYRRHIVNNNVFGHDALQVANDWHPDRGYSLNAGLQSRPWRASGIDWDDPGLWLAFSENVEDIDYICRDGASGYKEKGTYIHYQRPMQCLICRRAKWCSNASTPKILYRYFFHITFANCGGILGLFSGFSIVTLIELVYFLTIRIWSNIYRRWKEKRRATSQCNDRPENRIRTEKPS